MESNNYNKGAKYFSNVEKVLKSIKETYNKNLFNPKEENTKVLLNMVKCLVAIVGTQNDVLKYIISHDDRAIIDSESDEFIQGQFVTIKETRSIAVVKEVLTEDRIRVHLLNQDNTLDLLKSEIQ